jgi:hypothetical protein
MRAPASFCHFSPAPLRRLDQGMAFLGGAALLVLSALLASPIASAQAAATSSLDATGDFKSEMASCAKRATPQARKLCMAEARTAETARRAGRLDNHGGNFQANALRRCEVFKVADDRAACEMRVKSTRMDGSVIEGGILREAQITVKPPADTGMEPMHMPKPGHMPAMPMPAPAPMPMPSVPQ